MAEHSLLEKGSWVAGIASAIIATIVWINMSAPEKPPVIQKHEMRAPVPVIKGNADKQGKDSNSIAENSSKNTAWSCEGVASNLRPAFESAKNIYYASTKDAVLLALGRKALCIEDYQLFDEVVLGIRYSSTKDKAYSDAVDFTRGIFRFDLAEKYAGSIRYTSTRDAARARIAGDASVR